MCPAFIAYRRLSGDQSTVYTAFKCNVGYVPVQTAKPLHTINAASNSVDEKDLNTTSLYRSTIFIQDLNSSTNISKDRLLLFYLF